MYNLDYPYPEPRDVNYLRDITVAVWISVHVEAANDRIYSYSYTWSRCSVFHRVAFRQI